MEYRVPPHWPNYYPPAQPATFQVTTTPVVGCVCPPGANKDCENPLCPRKAPKPMAAA